MSSYVIVPNSLRDAINRKLDEALSSAPADAAADRGAMYTHLLAYFDEHGVLPEFSIVKNEEPSDGD